MHTDEMWNIIGSLKNCSDELTNRERRAKIRLNYDFSFDFCFAFLNFRIPVDRFEFSFNKSDAFVDDLKFPCRFVLRRVIEPPNAIEMSSPVFPKEIIGAASYFSSKITYELSIGFPDSTTEEFDLPSAEYISIALVFANRIISLIRSRTCADFLVPFVCNHSWSVISGMGENTCGVHFLENNPRAAIFGKDEEIEVCDLEWVNQNLKIFMKLYENKGFANAISAITTHQMNANKGMALAALWAGIEALVPVQSELSFRVAAYVSSFIECRGINRYEKFKEIRRLYNMRSKIVHGSFVSDEVIVESVLSTRRLLSNLVCKIIERGSIPDATCYEEIMFM